jgi:hypothetical protein
MLELGSRCCARIGDDVVILHRCKAATARVVIVVHGCGRKIRLFCVAIDSLAAAAATVGVRKALLGARNAPPPCIFDQFLCQWPSPAQSAKLAPSGVVISDSHLQNHHDLQ